MSKRTITWSSSKWALLLELLRHVGPFLALTLSEHKFLETIYGHTTRSQGLRLDLTHLVIPVPEILPRLHDILKRLVNLGLLLKRGQSDYVVNVYGLVRFYRQLAMNRRARPSKRVKVAQLLTAMRERFLSDQIPLVELAMPVPVLGPRPDCSVGRRNPVLETVFGRRRTVFKWRMIDAAMAIATRYLESKASFFAFMRCLNMTLERDAIEGQFSIERILYGHYDRGSLGLPLKDRAVRAALNRLEGFGLISITRRCPNHKTGQLTLNILGVAAVHARDHRSVRSLELYYSTYNLLDRLNRED